MAVAGVPGLDNTWVHPNPFGQTPDFFHRRAVLLQGRRMDLWPERTMAPGTIRRFWGRVANMISGGWAFNWSRNLFDDAPDGVNGVVTTSCRYMISTRYTNTGGNDLSNPGARDYKEYPAYRHAPNPAIIRAGQQQGRPTVRNRITSFGSRVPPINDVLPSQQIGA